MVLRRPGVSRGEGVWRGLSVVVVMVQHGGGEVVEDGVREEVMTIY